MVIFVGDHAPDSSNPLNLEATSYKVKKLTICPVWIATRALSSIICPIHPVALYIRPYMV